MLILDGPMGTELSARGIDTTLPLWSARALIDAPDEVLAIHREQVTLGAQVLTTNTFRTRHDTLPFSWRERARLAVMLARIAAPQRVAGSIAPLHDCYRPDLSPGERADHAPLANVLADAGCDLLLCETHPNVDEALAALRAARATKLPAWVAFTAGPSGDLLTPHQLSRAAERAAQEGASAILINCVAATNTTPYVRALRDALGDALPFGAYANAGHPDDEIGWRASVDPDATRYAELAQEWVDLGATILGACCGTRPAHVQALAARFANAT